MNQNIYLQSSRIRRAIDGYHRKNMIPTDRFLARIPFLAWQRYSTLKDSDSWQITKNIGFDFAGRVFLTNDAPLWVDHYVNGSDAEKLSQKIVSYLRRELL